MTTAINAPRLVGPLKWHGGKHYLAKEIVALMPAHTHYVEPFFGGGAVLLEKDPDGVSEVANDVNGWLTNFWNVLRDPQRFGQFQRMAEATPFSEKEWDDAFDAIAAEPDVKTHDPTLAAFRFFVRCRQSRSGLMKDFATLSRNRTRRRMNEQASAWLTAIEGLPAVHERLKRVVILNSPAVGVIREQDGPQTLFYLDPPYPHETRSSVKSYGKFEMSMQDHGELLEAVRQCKGKVMLSGYGNTLYHRKLEDWKRHTFDLPNNAASGDAKARMTEVLWCNY